MPLTVRSTFQLTALRANGTGVAGAQIRVLTFDGADLTASLFGTPTILTDSQGVFSGPITIPIQSLSQATIQVIAQYYTVWQVNRAINLLGSTFTANLVRISTADNYTVTAPAASFVSSMTPIACQVESTSNFPWENIRAKVERPDNSSSVIESPVDRQTHLSRLDLRNRVNLGTRPFLVKEPAIARPDTDFSSVIDVSLSSLTDEGENPIAGDFTLSVAATLPPDGKTDLSSYTSLDHQAWIVPSLPVIAFWGYYRDVMVWLPVPSLPGYILTTKYYDGAGNLIDTTTDTLTESPYVQRIRLNTDPLPGTVRSVLAITSGAAVTTQPLTVLYRD